MRKTLVLESIRQPQQRGSWDQPKQMLGNEILNIMAELDKDFITSKIERAHRANKITIEPFSQQLQNFQTGPFLNRLNPVLSKLQKIKRMKPLS